VKKSEPISPYILIAVAIVALAVMYWIYRKSPTFRKVVDTFNPLNIVLKVEQENFVRDLHPAFQNKFRQFIRDVEQSGWSVIVTSGYRTFARQAQLRAQDSRNAQPGLSLHNYGLAIDINAQRGATWLRKASSRKAWVDSGIPAIAKRHGLRWGGDFTGYHDPVHFDSGHSGSALRSNAHAQFGTDPAQIQGNQVRLSLTKRT
jgi:hypothetical protein